MVAHILTNEVVKRRRVSSVPGRFANISSPPLNLSDSCSVTLLDCSIDMVNDGRQTKVWAAGSDREDERACLVASLKEFSVYHSWKILSVGKIT